MGRCIGITQRLRRDDRKSEATVVVADDIADGSGVEANFRGGVNGGLSENSARGVGEEVGCEDDVGIVAEGVCHSL